MAFHGSQIWRALEAIPSSAGDTRLETMLVGQIGTQPQEFIVNAKCFETPLSYSRSIRVE